MPRKRRLHTVFLLAMIIIALLSILCIGCFWVSAEYAHFGVDVVQARHDYVEQQKAFVRREVERAQCLIADIQAKSGGLPPNPSHPEMTDVERAQQNALSHLKAMSANGAYLFAGDWNGVGLLGPGVGKNMIDVADVNGKKVVQELIAQSKAGGGFVEYVVPKGIGKRPAPKISYVVGIPEWEWYLGAGIYLDEIEALIAVRREELAHSIRQHLFHVAGMLVLLCGVALLVAHILSSGIKREIDRFTEFLDSAAKGGKGINPDSFKYREFERLANTGNAMIAHREAAQKSLKKSEEQFRSYFESSIVGMALTSPEKGWLLVNDRLCEMFGYTAEEFDKLTWADLTYPPDLASDVKQFDRVLGGELDSYSIEKRFVHKDGSLVSTIMSFRAFRDDHGKVDHGIALIHDVTEQQMLEEQLRQAQKMDSIGQLAGGIAHDFNNMLAGIMGAADMLAAKLSHDEKMMRFLEIILDSSEKAADLTRKLLTFSRKGRVCTTGVDVKRIADEVIAILEHTIDRRICIEKNYCNEDALLQGDPALIQNALLNLSVNARDAMPQGGTITLAVARATLGEAYCRRYSPPLKPGEYVEVSVSDTGTGIDRSIIDHIYEPFFTTKGVGKGTGLGLASVYGTIKDHDGVINVYSEVGKGTVFRIYIPVSEGFAIAPDDPERERLKGSGSILIIDDEEVLRNTGRALLTDMGFEVDTAEDGLNGVEIFTKNPDAYDLIILDMVMPRMGGGDCFRELRRIRPDIRVLIASGFSFGSEPQTLIDEGAVGFLQKPFRRKELFDAVISAMRKGS
jgi:PAS domain S-box-containing protein